MDAVMRRCVENPLQRAQPVDDLGVHRKLE